MFFILVWNLNQQKLTKKIDVVRPMEQELFKYQRRMRKVADNMGAGEMEKIAEAMGFNVRCMSSDVCRKSAFSSEVKYD